MADDEEPMVSAAIMGVECVLGMAGRKDVRMASTRSAAKVVIHATWRR